MKGTRGYMADEWRWVGGDTTAAPPHGSPDGALACVARVFLLEGLAATSTCLINALSHVRRGASLGQLQQKVHVTQTIKTQSL